MFTLPPLLLLFGLPMAHATALSNIDANVMLLPASHLKVMTFYGCWPSEQAGHTNLCISKNKTVLVEASGYGTKGMIEVTWLFFRNAIAPRKGLMLRDDYAAAWAEGWSTAGGIEELSKNGTIMGVFLGDELLGAGVNVTELTLAAETVKRSWPNAVVYWNEEWGPVIQNATWLVAEIAISTIRCFASLLLCVRNINSA
jgi:hypothetical protein